MKAMAILLIVAGVLLVINTVVTYISLVKQGDSRAWNVLMSNGAGALFPAFTGILILALPRLPPRK